MGTSKTLSRLVKRASNKAKGIAPVPDKLPVRSPNFDFSNTPLHWIPGDPQTSHTINVLHLLLPEGESWFCRAFVAVMPKVTDRGLRMQMRGFTGQEAEHANAHARLYELLERNEIDPHNLIKYVEWLFHTPFGEQPFNIPLTEKGQERWDLFRMAGVAAVEHFTGLLGSWLLRNGDVLKEAGADEAMMDLLLWHAAEEVEHQAVAHNIYRHLDGPEYLRWAAMGLTLPILSGLWIWGTLYMQSRDPYVNYNASPMGYIRAYRKGLLPGLGFIFGSVVPTYFKRDYFPGKLDQGATAIAEEYLKSAPWELNELQAQPA